MARTGRTRLWLRLAPMCCVATPGHAQQPLPSNVEATTVATSLPAAIAYDSAGNLYIAAANDNVVRKVDANGLITIVAGTGEQGFGGDGGAATNALLNTPMGVAVGAGGDIYIADSGNQRIREVVDGTIQTVAGTGVAGFGGDGGPAAQAQLAMPTALSVSAAGFLYLADTGNQRIREIVNGTITTVAGTGEQGFAGDGGLATQALLNDPAGVAADPTTPGQFYLSDTHNERVRRVAANGTITTVAGTGIVGSGGDGAAATAAGLAGPMGLFVGPDGTLYLADTDNQRIRMLSGGTIATIAGTGEQGFSGDTGAASAALLDTPYDAVAGSNAVAIADTNNQRVRSVTDQTIETVAGIAPPMTEGLLLNGPVSAVYGTTLAPFTATFSNGTNTATGQVTLADSGTVVATATLQNNTATLSPQLGAGLHALAVSYAGDAANAPVASGLFLVRIAQSAQTIQFAPLPSQVTYPAATPLPLSATASSGLPVSFSVTGPATLSGSTLSFTGTGTVTVTAAQAGNDNYAAAATTQTVTVTTAAVTPAITAVDPGSVTLGASNVTIYVTGSGFTPASVVKVNGTAVPTIYVSTTQLSATVPAVTTLAPLSIVVVDPSTGATSPAASLTVVAPQARATLSVPATSASGEQPSVGVALQAAYPAPLTATLTLTFVPAGTPPVDDPAIQFSSGGRTTSFTIPAGTTTAPSVAIQTGTVAGTITVSLQLTSSGTSVPSAAGQTATITIPPQAPSASVTFMQAGSVVTATVTGFSNTRDMQQAVFDFTPAPGTTLQTPSLTLPVTTIFDTWFGDAASASYGSTFTYTQTFDLNDPNARIGGITVTLTNSAGSSAPAVSQ